jgi:hypothetical protein
VGDLHLFGAIEVDKELARRRRVVPVLGPADLRNQVTVDRKEREGTLDRYIDTCVEGER